jgi:hypothetical protein
MFVDHLQRQATGRRRAGKRCGGFAAGFRIFREFRRRSDIKSAEPDAFNFIV